jgi:hypothetical protein
MSFGYHPNTFSTLPKLDCTIPPKRSTWPFITNRRLTIVFPMAVFTEPFISWYLPVHRFLVLALIASTFFLMSTLYSICCVNYTIDIENCYQLNFDL